MTNGADEWKMIGRIRSQHRCINPRRRRRMEMKTENGFSLVSKAVCLLALLT